MVFRLRDAVLTSLMLACTACGGGSATPFIAPPLQVIVPGGGSSLTLTGIGTSASISVREADPSSPVTAHSSNPKVVVVGAGAFNFAKRAQDVYDTFELTAAFPGTAVVTFSDSHSNVESITVTVVAPTPGAVITLSPASLSFTATGSNDVQTVNVSQKNYNGPFVVISGSTTNSCAGIVTTTSVSPSSFNVTPLAAGHCTLTVGGAGGVSQTLPITVTT